ncbi:hypothetical protein CesoFtcFv8_005743 [Champsocephalus esox]|uniref:Collagen IV NC1 domain-containing protein n=1 Tax=Champsocephalus esox TaxID=159716 RepID=A0AAN8CI58_9TELE|nr:hypothetical protein CesoFtcFv8_005743 [Champsocephalus esox]
MAGFDRSISCMTFDVSGCAGEAGDPGENSPVPGDDGVNGDTGCAGPRGPQGSPGPPGQPGLSGSPGDKGFRGSSGLMGLPGTRGPRGFTGPGGFPGPKGSSGPVGPKGEQGRVSPCPTYPPSTQGPSGDPGPPGTPGDIGVLGEMGRTGPKGRKGDLGPEGPTGPGGSSGPDGDRGDLGLQGERGPVGGKGDPGPMGDRGPSGPPKKVNSGFMLVMHSQSELIPSCPVSMRVLWVGYSLLYLEGQEKAHTQDLGQAGSCMRVFSTMPFSSCNMGTCSYASRNDKSYWLSTTAAVPSFPSSSRPECPPRWGSLWSGYSFLMHTGAGDEGGGQSLTSSGSCLKDFRAQPFVECQGPRGTCHYFANIYSFWLTRVEASVSSASSDGASSTLKESWQQRESIGRCNVCMRE